MTLGQVASGAVRLRKQHQKSGGYGISTAEWVGQASLGGPPSPQGRGCRAVWAMTRQCSLTL